MAWGYGGSLELSGQPRPLKVNSNYKVGRGDKILFWKENWSGQGALQALFPGLFSICTNPEVKVGEIWSPRGWNLAFRRLLNDWEIARVADLFTIISGFLGFNMETPPGWTVLSK